MIVFASESTGIRDSVKKEIKSVLAKKPSARIVDVGGGINSWLGELVTDIIDINDTVELNNPRVSFYKGDICDPNFWEHFPDNFFDFASCTHTLEDIRDPKSVIKSMSRTAKAGFIAVPNRHQELSKVESKYWNGYCHHRWVFHLTNQKLYAVGKFSPITIPPIVLPQLLKTVALKVSKIPRLAPKFDYWARPNIDISWLKPEWATTAPTDIELGLIWREEIPFEYWNSDFPGNNQTNLINNVSEFLRSPFSWEQKEVL